MKYCVELNHFDDLDELISINPDQVILGMKKFSKVGNLNIFEVEQSYKKLLSNNISISFAWDALQSQGLFEISKVEFLQLSFYRTINIRLQDAGVFNFILNQFSNSIELVLDWGNHNLAAIEAWINYSRGRVSKVILSSQIPVRNLKIFSQKIECSIELLGFGRPLIFYTPRKLLKDLSLKKNNEVDKDLNEDIIKMIVDGEETSHKNFIVTETSSGTFMYYSKIISLIDELDTLNELDISYLRFDFEFVKFIQEARNQIFSSFNLELPVIKGFYKVNKSDILFKKLKNSFLEKYNNNPVGSVIDVQKNKYMVLKIFETQHIKIGDCLLFYTPDQKVKSLKLSVMRNMELITIDSSTGSELVVLPHLSGVSIKSICHFSDNQ